MTCRIAVCICTYDRYDLLPKAIESVCLQSLNRSKYRVMVIDNSPDPEKAEAVAKHYRSPEGNAGGLVSYHVEKTPGLSNARNVGSRDCGTEFIAFMDDDAIASHEWLENLVDGFDRFGQNAVVAGGKVEPIWEIERPSWLHDWNMGYVSVVDWGGQARIASPSEWLAGTNIAFRTSALLEFGGFDQSLGRIGGGATLLSNEEIAMLRHFRSMGRDSLYLPQASVRHLVPAKRLTREWFRKRTAWQAVSDFMMHPAQCSQRARNEWNAVLDYFFEIPPRQRNVLGFYLETDSAILFQRQLRALEVFMLGSLSGFDGVSDAVAG
jgi:glycosyltransferase involved in cell wall biosynthesis